MSLTMRRIGAVAAVSLAGVLGACGQDASTSTAQDQTTGSASQSPAAEPGESTSTPAEPSQTIPADAQECNEVWQAGAELPALYRGCVEDGQYIKADRIGCSSGQRLVIYADRYWGVERGTVKQSKVALKKSPEYLDSIYACRA